MPVQERERERESGTEAKGMSTDSGLQVRIAQCYKRRNSEQRAGKIVGIDMQKQHLHASSWHAFRQEEARESFALVHPAHQGPTGAPRMEL